MLWMFWTSFTNANMSIWTSVTSDALAILTRRTKRKICLNENCMKLCKMKSTQLMRQSAEEFSPICSRINNVHCFAKCLVLSCWSSLVTTTITPLKHRHRRWRTHKPRKNILENLYYKTFTLGSVSVLKERCQWANVVSVLLKESSREVNAPPTWAHFNPKIRLAFF